MQTMNPVPERRFTSHPIVAALVIIIVVAIILAAVGRARRESGSTTDAQQAVLEQLNVDASRPVTAAEQAKIITQLGATAGAATVTPAAQERVLNTLQR